MARARERLAGALGFASRARGTALPAALGASPLGAGAFRVLLARGRLWLWGDQAVIDIEARNSLYFRNLLGVYDRYGWHHPGALWLLLLGLFRFVGAASPDALVFGSYAVQAAAAASIVVVAARLRRGNTAWLAAVVVVGYEWDFGPERLGNVWAPYAVALPAALLLLLVADFVANEDPWPAALGTVFCATFLVQTDLSTAVVALAVVAVAVALRLARRARPLWWAEGRRRRLAALAATVVVLWLPPVVQQLASDPGNLGLLARFFTTHHARRPWASVLRALGTVFGTFPLRRGPHGSSLDAKLNWLASVPLRRRPWYLAYLGGTAATVVAAAWRRRRSAACLAALSLVALLAAAVSVKVAYGPLFPYLAVWMGALAVPAWLALWLLVAPAGSGALRPLASWATKAAAFVASGAAVVAFAVTASPMEGTASVLGWRSWSAVASQVSLPQVRTVLVDLDGRDAMPEAAAIADQAARHGRRVEVDRAALYFFDPSLAPTAPAQLKVVVCCGRGDPGAPPPGVAFRARVGGQSIFSSRL